MWGVSAGIASCGCFLWWVCIPTFSIPLFGENASPESGRADSCAVLQAQPLDASDFELLRFVCDLPCCLSQFDRIVEVKNGLALAEAGGNYFTPTNILLPHQTIRTTTAMARRLLADALVAGPGAAAFAHLNGHIASVFSRVLPAAALAGSCKLPAALGQQQQQIHSARLALSSSAASQHAGALTTASSASISNSSRSLGLWPFQANSLGVTAAAAGAARGFASFSRASAHAGCGERLALETDTMQYLLSIIHQQQQRGQRQQEPTSPLLISV